MNAPRSVTSFTSITTSDNERDKHSKGPFVHVIRGPAASAHKGVKEPSRLIAREGFGVASRTAPLRLLQLCRDRGCFDRIAILALTAGARLHVGDCDSRSKFAGTADRGKHDHVVATSCTESRRGLDRWLSFREAKR